MMRAPLALLLVGVAPACAGLNVGSDEGCAAACAVAEACGFLPSNLGYGAAPMLAGGDCERRCRQSPRDDPAVTTLLSCLDGTWEPPDAVQVVAWCDDLTGTSAYVDGLACATAATCLEREFPGAALQGEVALQVVLISFTDYATLIPETPIAQVYADALGEVASCSEALCAKSECAVTNASDDAAELPCNDALCRAGMYKNVEICDELGAQTIEVLVTEQGRRPAAQLLFDANESADCDGSSVTFDSVTYALRPGPIQTYARVRGALPAEDLALLGYVFEDTDSGGPDTGGPDTGGPDTGDTDDPPLVSYCLQFVGMNVTARGGENIALVPVGPITEVAALGLTPQTCAP